MTIPSVTGVAPVQGGAGGGTLVTVTGTSFIAGSTVNFGVPAATGVVIGSVTSITCNSPAHIAGVVDVTVTNSGGTSPTGAPDLYTYLAIPAIPGAFLDIDFTQRAQVLNQLGTLVNSYLTYWGANQAPVSVPAAGSGGTYISGAGTFRNFFNALMSVNTQFALGIATPPVPANNLDFSAFQSTANNLLTFLTALRVAKP